MSLDKDSTVFGIGVAGVGAWLLFQVIRLFRRERSGFHGDKAQQEVIESLREELARKDRQLEDKEATIQVLVKEKAAQMEQLAIIPAMREELHEMDLQLKSLVELFNHLIESGALNLRPEHTQMVFSMMSRRRERNELGKGISELRSAQIDLGTVGSGIR